MCDHPAVARIPETLTRWIIDPLVTPPRFPYTIPLRQPRNPETQPEVRCTTSLRVYAIQQVARSSDENSGKLEGLPVVICICSQYLCPRSAPIIENTSQDHRSSSTVGTQAEPEGGIHDTTTTLRSNGTQSSKSLADSSIDSVISDSLTSPWYCHQSKSERV